MSDESVSDIGEPNVDALLAEAIAHHRDGELSKAERGYEAVLAQDPENPDAHHLLGVVAGQMGNTMLAIQRVKRSLEANPNQPAALNNLGNLLFDAEQLELAVESYQQAIDLDDENVQAHHNLGNVLGDLRRRPEAIESYRRALAIDPQSLDSWLAMGSCLESLGQFEAAEASYREAREVDETSVGALSRLGAVLRKMLRLAEAIEVYEKWLEIDADNPIATHLLVACRGEAVPDRAADDYVKRIFDGFAEEFDDCLAELDYSVPETLGAMVRDFWESASDEVQRGSIVDLGCGTGLCAPYLRKHTDYLIGVDLSPRMLEKAEERRLYDKTVEAELTAYLLGCEYDEHGAIVASDTLIYLGDLRPMFAAAKDALRSGGALVFSLERLDDDESTDFQLGSSGRYVHREAAVRNWLEEAGFSVDQFVESTLRKEGVGSVNGYLVVATKR